MRFPLRQTWKTGELALAIGEGRQTSETSHAGMIRIGFEGIFSAPLLWGTPVSITQLKHHLAGLVKQALQRTRGNLSQI
jgi:hypothetical protein